MTDTIKPILAEMLVLAQPSGVASPRGGARHVHVMASLVGGWETPSGLLVDTRITQDWPRDLSNAHEAWLIAVGREIKKAFPKDMPWERLIAATVWQVTEVDTGVLLDSTVVLDALHAARLNEISTRNGPRPHQPAK